MTTLPREHGKEKFHYKNLNQKYKIWLKALFWANKHPLPCQPAWICNSPDDLLHVCACDTV